MCNIKEVANVSVGRCIMAMKWLIKSGQRVYNANMWSRHLLAWDLKKVPSFVKSKPLHLCFAATARVYWSNIIRRQIVLYKIQDWCLFPLMTSQRVDHCYPLYRDRCTTVALMFFSPQCGTFTACQPMAFLSLHRWYLMISSVATTNGAPRHIHISRTSFWLSVFVFHLLSLRPVLITLCLLFPLKELHQLQSYRWRKSLCSFLLFLSSCCHQSCQQCSRAHYFHAGSH